MTRINSGVNPKLLTDEHLLAEHREIKRICDNFYKRQLKNKFDDIPDNFTLGKGHVLFFIDKPDFTLSRYKSIREELIKREFNVTDYSDNWKIYKDFKGKEYNPSKTDNNIIIDRITDRILLGKLNNYHYYKNKISKTDSIELLNELI